MIRRLMVLVCVACALAVALPGVAFAGSPTSDCNAHGRLTQHYSDSQLQTALAEMPADVQEYTNCYDVIHSALLAQISGIPGHAGTSSSDSGGSFLPTGVIVAIVVVVLVGTTAGAFAVRRRVQQ